MVAKNFGIAINVHKTKMMVVNKQRVENVQPKFLDKHIERVQYFKFLGSWLNADINANEEKNYG